MIYSSRNLCSSAKRFEEERNHLLDITVGMAVVPYRGNDTWAGLKGKVLRGHKCAQEYAKKLNACIGESTCTI